MWKKKIRAAHFSVPNRSVTNDRRSAFTNSPVPLFLSPTQHTSPLPWIDSTTSCLATVRFRARKPYLFQPLRSPIETLTFRAPRRIFFSCEFLEKNALFFSPLFHLTSATVDQLP